MIDDDALMHAAALEGLGVTVAPLACAQVADGGECSCCSVSGSSDELPG